MSVEQDSTEKPETSGRVYCRFDVGLDLKKGIGTIISQGVWGWEGSGEAVEGISGSVCTERNFGRKCMVPGDERSQPQLGAWPGRKRTCSFTVLSFIRA